MTTVSQRRAGAFLPLDLQFTASVQLGTGGAIVRFGGELDLASHVGSPTERGTPHERRRPTARTGEARRRPSPADRRRAVPCHRRGAKLHCIGGGSRVAYSPAARVARPHRALPLEALADRDPRYAVREVVMPRLRNPLAALFARPRREEYLAQYVIRECSRGRALAEVLEDRYVLNRSTSEERARLLERPDVVAAIGKNVIAEMRAGRLLQSR
jgi:hypothetical protein